MEFTVIQGDIAEQSADALVNASGTSLKMGSGVAGALRGGANGPINEEAVSKGPVDLGEVAVTDAYDLDAEYIIHAAAMPHYGDGRATEESIRNATLNALRKADELDCNSVVLRFWGRARPVSPSTRALESSAKRPPPTIPNRSRTSGSSRIPAPNTTNSNG